LMETEPKSMRHSEAFDDRGRASVSKSTGDRVRTSGAKGHKMQNWLYALRALERLNLLGDDKLKQTLANRPALRWLVDEEGARWAVLTELGRIRDTGQFDTAVTWVLAHRPRTGEAVSRIRRFRTGRTEAPDARQLARDIIRTVNAYGLKHPYLTREQKLEALRLAAEEAADARQLTTDPGGCSAITTPVDRP
jgi:hypothetical protein